DGTHGPPISRHSLLVYARHGNTTAAPSPANHKDGPSRRRLTAIRVLEKAQRPPMPTRRSLAGQPSAGKTPYRPAVANRGDIEPSPLGKPGGSLLAHEGNRAGRRPFDGPVVGSRLLLMRARDDLVRDLIASAEKPLNPGKNQRPKMSCQGVQAKR